MICTSYRAGILVARKTGVASGTRGQRGWRTVWRHRFEALLAAAGPARGSPTETLRPSEAFRDAQAVFILISAVKSLQSIETSALLHVLSKMPGDVSEQKPCGVP